MLKPTKFNLEQTNIANLGTDLEKKVREAAGQHEAQWTNAGKAPGLQIWRIEKFTVKPVKKEDYGQFYSGDSYIVLNTYKAGGDHLAWNVHFWLGTQTSQDEAGTAAYKTVELDDHLGGGPVQYREVQGYESTTFLKYFPTGLFILEGGMETGFHHVKPEEYRTRLLHLSGTKQIRVVEVPLKASSINSSDVFILDAGLKIYQWNGSKSAGTERAKAAQVSRALDDNRKGLATVHVIAEGESGAESDAFWKGLGESGPVKVKETAEPQEQLKFGEKKLLRVSDASGSLKTEEVATGSAVNKSLLKSDDVFILDAGSSIFAWVGKNASAVERKTALSIAQNYLQKSGRPLQLSVSRIFEGGENEEFLSLLS